MLADLLLFFDSMSPETKAEFKRLVRRAMVSEDPAAFMRGRLQRIIVDEHWHHDLLGTQPGSSKAHIESAYRKLTFIVHPDRGGNERLMKLALEAKQKALEEL